MGKTLIINKEQLDEIIDGTPYLDTTEKGNIPPNSHLNVTTTSGGVLPSDFADPKTGKGHAKPYKTDDAADAMGPPTNNWSLKGRTGQFGGIPIAAPLEERYSKKEFEAKLLSEMNSQLQNITMTANITNQQDPNNPIQISGKEGKLAKEKTLAKQRGDVQTYNAISKVLDGRRQAIKNSKKINAQAGMVNQFQKPGGNKIMGNGQAHTKKNEPGIVTY